MPTRYSKTHVKWPLSKRLQIGFQDQLSLNAGLKHCRMLQGEHSAILWTFIKLPFVIKILFCLFLRGHFTQVLLYSSVSEIHGDQTIISMQKIFLVNSLLAGNFFIICFVLQNWLFFFSKKLFSGISSVSKSLDPDLARHFVGPDLGPNCLQRLSEDDRRCHWLVKS